jgi:hypothetical protein
LGRFESAKPRRSIASANDLYEWLAERLPEPDGEEFKFKADPPSRVESYRVHRSLWDLELFRHIYDAASTHWSTRDLDSSLNDMWNDSGFII